MDFVMGELVVMVLYNVDFSFVGLGLCWRLLRCVNLLFFLRKISYGFLFGVLFCIFLSIVFFVLLKKF